MFKRFMLGLVFVSAFSFVGGGTPDSSEARRFGGRPFVGRYYARGPVVYGSYRPYYYSPRYSRGYYYGPPRYYDYGYPDYYYYGPRSGVSVSFGW